MVKKDCPRPLILFEKRADCKSKSGDIARPVGRTVRLEPESDGTVKVLSHEKVLPIIRGKGNDELNRDSSWIETRDALGIIEARKSDRKADGFLFGKMGSRSREEVAR